MTEFSGIGWIEAGAVLRVPLITPESRGLWAEMLVELECGRKGDPLSALVFRAWRQRWWRGEERRGRRLFHYLRAAVEHGRAAQAVYGDPGFFAPMPLGAARANVSKSGGFWQPGEPKHDVWLATLPLFERLGGQLIAVECLAWKPDAPHRWWHARGTHEALGEVMGQELMRAGRPVRIYATPQRWNRAGGAGAPGCCIFDWDSAFAQELLAFSPVLVADDVGEARALQRRVDRRRPRVQFIARATLPKPLRRGAAVG